MNRIWVAMSLVALCACATSSSAAPGAEAPQAQASADGTGDRLVCRRERVVGSNRKRRVCQYESVRNRERDADQGSLGKRRSGAPPTAETPIM